MELIELTCPNCGSKLQVDASCESVYCQYCGTKIFLAEDKKQ